MIDLASLGILFLKFSMLLLSARILMQFSKVSKDFKVTQFVVKYTDFITLPFQFIFSNYTRFCVPAFLSLILIQYVIIDLYIGNSLDQSKLIAVSVLQSTTDVIGLIQGIILYRILSNYIVAPEEKDLSPEERVVNLKSNIAYQLTYSFLFRFNIDREIIDLDRTVQKRVLFSNFILYFIITTILNVGLISILPGPPL